MSEKCADVVRDIERLTGETPMVDCPAYYEDEYHAQVQGGVCAEADGATRLECLQRLRDKIAAR